MECFGDIAPVWGTGRAWFSVAASHSKFYSSSSASASSYTPLRAYEQGLIPGRTSKWEILAPTRSNFVSIGTSQPGFLLVDASLNPVASNVEAIQILTFPNKPERIKRLETFLADKVRSGLVDRQSSETLEFVKEFKSGNRRYLCRTFRLKTAVKGARPTVALLLERNSSGGAVALSQICKQFDLTQREKETVELLLQGLTSKEIAIRMKISPNTVKAFLRLVMVKMGVSTRSGIVGKIVGPQA